MSGLIEVPHVETDTISTDYSLQLLWGLGADSCIVVPILSYMPFVNESTNCSNPDIIFYSNAALSTICQMSHYSFAQSTRCLCMHCKTDPSKRKSIYSLWLHVKVTPALFQCGCVRCGMFWLATSTFYLCFTARLSQLKRHALWSQ